MSNLTKTLATFAGALLAAAALSAAATPRLDIVPGVTQTTTGSTFSVDVFLSGLATDAQGNPAPNPWAITDYDISISYDVALMHILSVTFGSGLAPAGNPYSSGSFLTPPGTVEFAEASGADYGTLRGLQGAGFRLATLTFQADAVGTSSLQFLFDFAGGLSILDAIGNDGGSTIDLLNSDQCAEVGCASVGGGRVVIRQGTNVPTPDTLPLAIAAACAGIFAFQRRRSSVRSA